MSDRASPRATASKSGAPDPLVGRVIADRFKVTSLIARGGMGKVYRAEQSPLGRVCAIKILNPNYTGDADPEFHRRFYREASIASKITHPNSVTIFDYGKTDDDVYYMVMEYLEGQTLHQAIREAGTFSEDRVGRIAQQICRALREAHALGVIHRDMKPANIFLTRHGDDEDFVKVLDFGLVKHLAERPEEQLTQTGLFMGSPKYMAPEQIQGGHVDARTDIYSLGIMMYEMLTGKVPFERPTSVNILMAHVGEPPPPMREINPHLICSPAFEELVMRCISKDPAERYTSMDDVLQMLKRLHGASLTGQLAVLATGAFAPLRTMLPPPGEGADGLIDPAAGVETELADASSQRPATPAAFSYPSSSQARAAVSVGSISGLPASGTVSTTTRSSVPPTVVLTTGSHASLSPPPDGADASTDARSLEPRRRALIAVGIAVAAAIGGVLGMVAFRFTSAPPKLLNLEAAATVPAALAVPPAAAAPLPATIELPRQGTVQITTDPPGASVHEDAAQLCVATPCEVTYSGEDAEGTKVHKLVVSKPGFRAEVVRVRVSDAPLQLKLTRFAPPRPQSGAGAAAPAQRAPEPAVPSEFKPLPY